MPREYNFDQLSPREFEFLCRDLVQKKIRAEGNLFFFLKSFPEGRDDGIDAIFHDETKKIVLQCKRYKSFDQLFATLKNSELFKVKKIKPTRYLLCVRCSLSKGQTEKIFDLFKGYIHTITDIVDGLMLNNLLDEFPEIELNYPKLYLSSTTTLGHILHADIYNQSSFKLNYFHGLINKFVAGPSFHDALNILIKQHYLIISGEPGVGKSTMAGMLGLYFVEQGYEFIFVRKRIAEATGAVQKEGQKQVFFFDDFLGSTTFEGFDRNEDRELLDFIRACTYKTDKLLIVTTREYVFKQAELKYPELKELNYNKCFIRQKEFSKGFKINIFYNYLYYSKVEWHHIEPLLYNNDYERLIHHNNFTPRLLSEYINKYYDSNESAYSFLLGFEKYLDDPYTYWEAIFKRLSDASQMLMLIIGVTPEPTLEWIIFETFCHAGKRRHIYETGHEHDAYNAALSELTGSFISIFHNPTIGREEGIISSRDLSLMMMTFGRARYVEFQNPSIKDFTISYLRNREDLQSILINSAVVFSQLYFAFTTSKDNEQLEDEEFDYYYTASKILLVPKLQVELADKATKEFDELPIVKVRKISWTEGIDSFHLNEHAYSNRILKLLELCVIFPLAEYPLIKVFVVQKYQQILKEESEYFSLEMHDQADSRLTPLSLDERLYQVDIIKKIAPYINLDSIQTVQSYYKNIRFSEEFLILDSFKEIFPETYKQFIIDNIKNIRSEIKYMLIDDIDYYLWEGTHEAEEALDYLLDMKLEQLEEAYKIKLSVSWKKRINNMTEREIFQFEKQENQSKVPVPEANQDYYANNHTEDKHIYKSYQSALMRLRPQWVEIRYGNTPTNYLRSLSSTQKSDSKLIKRIQLFANKHDSNLLYWLNTAEMLYSFFAQSNIKIPKLKDFYQYILSVCKLSQKKLVILTQIAFEFMLYEVDTFRKSTFADKIGQYSIELTNEETVDELLSCALMRQDDIWYSFLSLDLQCYLAAMYVENLKADEKKILYDSFVKIHTNIDRRFILLLWKYCKELDMKSFIKYFVNPVLYKELNRYHGNTPEKIAIDYLKTQNFEFSYKYYQEEDCYDLDSSSYGDELIDDIMACMGVSKFIMFEALEICFNISNIDASALRAYVIKYCLKADGSYDLNINKEFSRNSDFISVLHACGAIATVNNYLGRLKKCYEQANQQN